MNSSGDLYDPAALPSRKEHPIRSGWESVWAPEPVWTLWKGGHLCFCQESNPNSLIVQAVT
jgi:hypothetical protein